MKQRIDMKQGIDMKISSPAEFTIIELLLVVSIIMILASLLLPALQSAKNKARDIYCVGKCKQIAVAITVYAGDSNGFGPIDQWHATIRGTWEYSHLAWCWSDGPCYISYCFVKQGYLAPKALECPIRTSNTPSLFCSANYGVSKKVFNSSYEIKGSNTSVPNIAWDSIPSRFYPWRVGQTPGEPMVWGRIYRSSDGFVHFNGLPLAYEDGSGIFAPVKKKTIIKWSSYDIDHGEAKMSWIRLDICRGGNFLK